MVASNTILLVLTFYEPSNNSRYLDRHVEDSGILVLGIQLDDSQLLKVEDEQEE